ncbi:thioredoxin [Paenibacillaceae bacterium]|nr:thioredoxin [Paenibacillaceae bacterium]
MREQPDKADAVLFVTPLCGTCKLAERMLAIVQIASPELKLFKININYAPHLRNEWKLTSVPALVILQDGSVVRTEYALHSVDYVHALMTNRKEAGQ